MNTTATAPRYCSRGRWTALNIVLMIVGFALFWPLGLAMLAFIIWGDEIGRKAESFKGQVQAFSERASGFRPGPFRDTGNVAFDEYRTQELKRLEEERRKLEEMRAEFETFLRDLRRVKDQEEFDRFMTAFRDRTATTGEAGA